MGEVLEFFTLEYCNKALLKVNTAFEYSVSLLHNFFLAQVAPSGGI